MLKLYFFNFIVIYKTSKNVLGEEYEEFQNNIITETFNQFTQKYKEDECQLLFNKFKSYFIKEWKKYFDEGSLNYIYLDKKQRSNSYLENYNRRIKDILGPFLSKRGKTVIPWPLFITFLKNEEI